MYKQWLYETTEVLETDRGRVRFPTDPFILSLSDPFINWSVVVMTDLVGRHQKGRHGVRAQGRRRKG